MAFSYYEMDIFVKQLNSKGDGQKSVMKINANTNAIMSSDGDGTILWILREVNIVVFVTACYCVFYNSLQD